MMSSDGAYPALGEQEGQPQAYQPPPQYQPVQSQGYAPASPEPLLGDGASYAQIPPPTTGEEQNEASQFPQNYHLVLIICAASAFLMVQGAANCDRAQW